MSSAATVRAVTATYEGPVRGEPLPIELHNTLFAVRGQVVDGLADSAGLRAWVAALGDRLPSAVDGGRLDDVVALRTAVRDALVAAVEGRAIPDAALSALNRASAASPRSLQLTRRGSEIRYHAPSDTDAVLGVLASDTIVLVSGPRAQDLRACGAPGCMLLFLKDHPRREWCSTTCGNRARQARHYARTRSPAPS
jgi:predicted RNA-binding Zn ribbon-like protein